MKHINQNAHSDGDIILAAQSMLCAKSFLKSLYIFKISVI